MYHFQFVVYSDNDSILHCTTFKVYVTVFDLEKSFGFEKTVTKRQLQATQGRRHVLNFRGSGNFLKTVGYILPSHIRLGLHVRINTT